MIEESRKQIQTDPHDAFHLAELARIVIHHSPNVAGAFNLIALATAHMANACRAMSDYRQAVEHFGHARAALLLFQEAARQEELTLKLAREVAAFLKAARVDPSLRFPQKKPS